VSATITVEETAMPIVTIQLTDEDITLEQKKKLVEGATELLHQVMSKDPNRIYVLIEEVPLANWSAGGVLTTDRRASGLDGICDCGQHSQAKEAMKSKLLEYGYRPGEQTE
jgi:4-oxalocrotonate tautomerase